MKLLHCCAVVCLSPFLGYCQPVADFASDSDTTVNSISSPMADQAVDLVQQVGSPGEGVYAITEAGPHHRRWSKLEATRRADGSPGWMTVSYIEMASGLNRMDFTGR